MTQFELVFNGKLVDGFLLDQVKQNVGKLFKASPAQVEQMFSGKTVVLKNRLDDATAKKYRMLLQKHGAACIIRQMGGQHAAPAPAQTNGRPSAFPAAKQTQTPATSEKEAAKPLPKPVTTATGLPVAGEKVDDILHDIDWDIAPVGSRMEDEHDDLPLPEPDLSHLTVAPAGSDMGQKKAVEPPPPPDTSHIKLK